MKPQASPPLSPTPTDVLPDRLAALALALWPFLYFWRAALGLGVFFVGDMALFWYPTRAAYAAALHAGQLPMWVRAMFGGFPLFAEMQTGALYPPHLVLYFLLPTDLALNWDVLLHLAWMGLGVFFLARRLRMGTAGAFLAALVYACGGLAQGRIGHLNVLSTVAWMPWILFLYERWSEYRRGGDLSLLTLALAAVILIGHPQFALLSFLLFAAYGLARSFGLLPGPGYKRDWLAAAGAGALAVGVAAVQVLPTLELAAWSSRTVGAIADFGVSFSLHPLQIALLLDPFVQGNPYPQVSVEVTAYLGLVPLLLSGSLLMVRRDRVVLFWLSVAAAALFFALGSYNPFYRLILSQVMPSFFRAPARFLYLLYFSLALLAGLGLDTWLSRLDDATLTASRSAKGLGMALVFSLALIAGLAPFLPADVWITAWQGYACLLGAGVVTGLWRWRRRRISRPIAIALVLGASAVDLALFGAVYAGTYNALLPRSEIAALPRVLDLLDRTPGQARIYTSRWIAPWPEVMRESLYPNLGLAYGVESAPGYTPLTPFSVQEYLGALSAENNLDRQGHVPPPDPCVPENRTVISSPSLLNALNVRYYIVPQVLPATPACERADVWDPLLIQVNELVRFAPVRVDSVVVESSLAQSAELVNGAPVAEIQVMPESGPVVTRTIVAGRDTSEWAYDRSDVQAQIKHARAPVASSFPARSAIPVESHVGHTYEAEFPLEPGARVTGLRVVPYPGPAILHLAGIYLVSSGVRLNVASLAGHGDHRLIYRDENAAVFENRDALQRARLVHAAQPVQDRVALELMSSPGWEPQAQTFLSEGPALAATVPPGATEETRIVVYDERRVVVEVKAAAPAYLLLADTYYPGWTARVDGTAQPIYRADVMFRAVRVEPGDHRVEFLYEPDSFRVGIMVSGAALLLLALPALQILRRSRPRPRIW